MKFLAVFIEPKYQEFQEYYQIKDFIVGSTIIVLGRRYVLAVLL